MARHHELTRIDLDAALKAAERFTRSSAGMLRTARELRQRSAEMLDCGDRDVMLRLASEFERRAEEISRGPKS
jgi:hypothetical protein